MNEELYIGDDVYEVVPDEARIATEYLIKLRDKLGITDEFELEDSNKIILSYAFQIYKVWAASYPYEHRQFIENTELELKYERPVRDAVKAGGYFPVSYPPRLDNMYHVLMPKVKTQDKRFWFPLLQQIPELRRTNYFNKSTI